MIGEWVDLFGWSWFSKTQCYHPHFVKFVQRNFSSKSSTTINHLARSCQYYALLIFIIYWLSDLYDCWPCTQWLGYSNFRIWHLMQVKNTISTNSTFPFIGMIFICFKDTIIIVPNYLVEKHEWMTAMGTIGYEVNSKLSDLGWSSAFLKSYNV